VLTVLRLLVVPVFAWAYLNGRIGLAWALFTGAALTDGLDGIAARALHAESRLGALLDPLADKLLTGVALVLITLRGGLPVWLLAIFVVKELGTLAGAVSLRAHVGSIPGPVMLGKQATFALLAAIGTALLDELGLQGMKPAALLLSVVASLCAVGASMQYFARWRRLLRAPPRSPSPTP
jgi:cardiolipin synthase